MDGEIDKIKNDYQRDKERPPIVRNLPPVAGAITWSRHLLYRISVPMEQFPQDLVRQRTSNIRQHVNDRLTYAIRPESTDTGAVSATTI